MTVTLVVFAALLLDAWLGEPRRLHPLVGFGRWVKWLEQRIYADAFLRGVVAIFLLLVPFTVAAAFLHTLPFGLVFEVILLYLAIGWNSLGQHARIVRDRLLVPDLPAARQRVGYMVSRDTAALDEHGVAKATVESVLENGNDAVFGAIFWFVVAGAPGVVLYRLANTLDAMWGYRNARYLRFGWAAARFDDVLNFIPARLTALSYALMGHTRLALHCWRTQAPTWDSPNAGPVMAAGAGALAVTLGGPAVYEGEWHERPTLGTGRAPAVAEIDYALGLVRRSVWLWVVAIGIIEGVVSYA